jgi:hypothetical protein
VSGARDGARCPLPPGARCSGWKGAACTPRCCDPLAPRQRYRGVHRGLEGIEGQAAADRAGYLQPTARRENANCFAQRLTVSRRGSYPDEPAGASQAKHVNCRSPCAFWTWNSASHAGQGIGTGRSQFDQAHSG